jgi:adenosylhomocysteine nucleosidase
MGMSGSGRVIAVTSLALEARIALGPGVSVICQQGAQLSTALAAAVERGAAGIISFGIAGGLAPDLVAGDWIVGAAVTTGREHFPTDRAWARKLLEVLPGAQHAEIVGADAPVASAVDKRRLHARTGAAVVDTESHIAARIAAACRIPFAVCRTVIDAVDMDLPPAAMVGLHQDGTPDLLAVLRSVVWEPSQLPALVRTALCARIAEAALRRGRRRLGAALELPHGHESAPDLQGARHGRAVPMAEMPYFALRRARGSAVV